MIIRPYKYNFGLPRVMSFLLVPHLPRLVARERRTTCADRHYANRRLVCYYNVLLSSQLVYMSLPIIDLLEIATFSLFFLHDALVYIEIANIVAFGSGSSSIICIMFTL